MVFQIPLRLRRRFAVGLVGLGAFLLILLSSPVIAQAQLSEDELLTIACNQTAEGLQLGGAISDATTALTAGLPQAREAAANVVSSRLVALAAFEATRPPAEALEALADNGTTAECGQAVQRPLVTVYSRTQEVLADPSVITPDGSHSMVVNVARAEAIYNHGKCSSPFRRKDPRDVLATHEAIARGTGQDECTFAAGEEIKTIQVDGSQAWWAQVFGDRLAGLWGTFGPFLSRDAGGANAFTVFGDDVCGALLDLAVNDEDPMIRAEAAQAYFSPMLAQRFRSGTITNVTFLCPEGLVGAKAPLKSEFDARPQDFIDPLVRLKLTAGGGSAELQRAAAFGASKALADLKSLSPLERVLGAGVLSAQGESELLQMLARVNLGSGRMFKEQVLDLFALRGSTSAAQLAGALALGLTWEDMLKDSERSSLLGAITQGNLVTFWFSSDVKPGAGVPSVWEERKSAIIAPLARLFAAANEQISNFRVNGTGIVGLPDLKP